MKVLFVHTYYKQSGGEDQVVENEIALLAKSMDVVKLSYYNTGSTLSTVVKFMLAFNNKRASQRLKKVVKKERPDVIHLHNWHFAASPAVIREAKKNRIPVVHTLHNFRLLCPSGSLFHDGKLFLDSLNKGFPWSAVKKGVFRGSVWQTFWLVGVIRLHHTLGTWRSIDKYIALSSTAKDLFTASYLRLAPNQLIVKPNFISNNSFSTTNRSSHFLFVGRLTGEKGIPLLLEAFSKMHQKLAIIGDGPLKELVETYSMSHSNISYLGRQNYETVIEEMKAASALVFTSTCFEGMPMTILEAFSTGTPVIASRLGAMETLIADGVNGLLFEPGVANDLIEKVTSFSKVSEEAKTIFSTNARKSYELNYTPDKNLHQLVEIYTSVIKTDKIKF
jgi:glycosyltransferase involved in cell wall biosynthesis